MPKRRRVDQHGLDALIRQRQGVVRVRDLHSLGVPASTVSYRTRPSGPWQRTLPGVIATMNGPPTWVQRALASVCYGRGGAVVSGITALRLQGVSGLAEGDGRIHLLVPHRRQRSSVAYVHVERTRRMPAHRTLRGVPCVPVARAVIDAGRQLRDLDTVRGLAAAAVQQRRRCTVAELVQELRDAPRQWSRVPRLVLSELADGVRSVAEARVRDSLRRAGPPEPLWNHDVYDSDGNWLGRPDAFWPELAVALEIDSMAWHLSPASYRRTQARQRRMTKAGVLVIPVAPGDAGRDSRALVHEVATTLDTARRRTPPFTRAVPPAR